MSISDAAAQTATNPERSQPTGVVATPKRTPQPRTWICLAAVPIALLAETAATASASRGAVSPGWFFVLAALAIAALISRLPAVRQAISNVKRHHLSATRTALAANAEFETPGHWGPTATHIEESAGADTAVAQSGSVLTISAQQDRAVAEIDPLQAQPAAQSSSLFTDTPTLGIATLLDIFEGDVTSVSDIFAAALTSIEVDLARIRESAATRDMKTVGIAAHRMKGTSGSVRSQRIMDISATLQAAAKHDQRRIDDALLLSLGQAVAEFRKDVEAFRGHLANASDA